MERRRASSTPSSPTTRAINDYGDVDRGDGCDPGSLHRGAAGDRDRQGRRRRQRSHVGGLRLSAASASPTTTPPYPKPATAAMPDGPQWVLEHWSNRTQRVPVHPRRGHRLRPRPNSNVVYLADTGEPRAQPDDDPGRPARARPDRDDGPVHERAHLQARRSGSNPLEGATLDILTERELRRARLQQHGRRPPAGQHRDDQRRPLHPGGPGLAQRRSRPAFPDATNARDLADTTSPRHRRRSSPKSNQAIPALDDR